MGIMVMFSVSHIFFIFGKIAFVYKYYINLIAFELLCAQNMVNFTIIPPNWNYLHYSLATL